VARENRGLRGLTIVVVLATALLVAPQLAAAAAPANDNFADAATIGPTLPLTANGTSTEATTETGEPDPAGWGAYASVWFKWTAPLTGYTKLSLCGGTTHDFAVYTGNMLGSLVKSVDSAFFGCSRTFATVAGVTYRIAIDNYQHWTGSQADFALSLRAASPPPNDQFANAQAIASAGTSGVDGDNFDATVEPGEPTVTGYDPPHKTAWYRWVAPANVGSEPYVDACTSGLPFDTMVGVYTGTSVDNLTAAPGPFAGHTNCRYPFAATPGTTYFISVDGFYDESPPTTTDEGEFTLTVDADAPPPNDDFASAEALSSSLPIEAEGYNFRATPEAGEPFHAGVEPLYSVWYRWSAPSTGPISIDTCDSDFDSLLAVYTGHLVSALTPVAANDDGAQCLASDNEFGSSVALNVTAGTVYRIAVDGFDEGTFALAIRATGPHTVPSPPVQPHPKKKKCRKAKRHGHKRCKKKHRAKR
jgi:hypothetical protein